MQLLDGKKTATEIKLEVAEEINRIKAKNGKIPHLVAVLVGSNGASVTYVDAKIAACEKVGMRSTIVRLNETVSERELLEEVDRLNKDDDIDGFIVQLPLPKHISDKKVTEAISPSKDVDGFHPWNIGKMMLNLPAFLPATPFGILQLIERYNIETNGKHCVVVGRSSIVGSPIANLMSRNSYPGNCTVTLTHSRTVNLKEIILSADILIVALGKPEFITADMVKEGAVVFDVGITRKADKSKKSGYKLYGDVDFKGVAEKASFITPVPGGVGPMTIVSLLKNTLLAAKGK
ncbi:bifunctional 5,10-methylene-tetrahydrofolate dehydrogenase/5,10-methylene-tetrahydrofolate cyclohydrolase [Vicingaceae bacterium]|nr:bifunctional 5,10-methylene-tetrahydrofolate dehydrogenase/5,10-methylene-tetrahydrofolate cyclohydrolase [Vicingaceae bacterium]MDB9963999.1 bifunctional 5,10-methylene-tetrahydrofolate dehydrogenase/5,10-methylene-tetrahydrofolate cyclohydrolase [Vicingaceae bacterium]MDC1452528.1 bifunctional 5,10-methylene-tetrahydrofolate dehydrogenase/5,10-methylene-tetrahydrofolate cyclohydrolase [Vicingaceae bacterium]